MEYCEEEQALVIVDIDRVLIPPPALPVLVFVVPEDIPVLVVGLIFVFPALPSSRWI